MIKALPHAIVFVMPVTFLVHDHYVFLNFGPSPGGTAGEPHPLFRSGCGL